jgi:hypothetical protein
VILDLLALGFPIVLGLPLVLVMGPIGPWIGRISLAFLGGVVIAGVGVLCLSAIGFRLYDLVLAIAATAWVLGTSVWAWHRRALWMGRGAPFLSVGIVGFGLMTVLNLLTLAAHAATTPVLAYDATIFWVPKAEALQLSRTLEILARTVRPER